MSGLFWNNEIPLVNGEDMQELKKAFAAAYLKNPNNPFAASSRVFPGTANLQRASMAATFWPNDAEVIQHGIDIVEELGPLAYLPSKEEMVRDVLNIAENNRQPAKERIDAYKLAASIMGHITNKQEIKSPQLDPFSDMLKEISSNGRPKP